MGHKLPPFSETSRIYPPSSVRIAARLACLDADPLDWWDYGMLTALDVVEKALRDRLRDGESITAESVFHILLRERRFISSESLHSFFLEAPRSSWEKPPNARRRKSNKAALNKSNKVPKSRVLRRAAN